MFRQLYDACTMEITALWVYPIKACQGMSVQSAETTATGGFKLDREWCVVDLRGDRYPEREYISQRKLEQMATIAPALSADGASMTVTAPGMEPLVIPVAEEAYEANEAITVKCCGLSTTTQSGWRLGDMECRSAGDAAEAWFTEYLNRVDKHTDKPPARFVLCRSRAASTRAVRDHVLTADGSGAGHGAGHGIPGMSIPNFVEKRARAGDQVRFHDFAPFLLTNEASIAALNRLMGTSTYVCSMHCFATVVALFGHPLADRALSSWLTLPPATPCRLFARLLWWRRAAAGARAVARARDARGGRRWRVRG